jgi:tripartite-type tricarboxylate transporter receptor subunit TctC
MAASRSLQRGGGASAQGFPDRPITLIVPWAPAARPTATCACWPTSSDASSATEDRPEPARGKRHAGRPQHGAERQAGWLHAGAVPVGDAATAAHAEDAWHPLDDFTFIIGLSGYTQAFAVRATRRTGPSNEYIEAARREPGKINYGSSGVGTTCHLLVAESRALHRSG